MTKRVAAVFVMCLIAGILLLLSAPAGRKYLSQTSPSPTEHLAPTLIVGREIDIALVEQNGSGFKGEVRIKEVNGKLSIAAWASSKLPDENLLIPVVLHKGSCQSPGAVHTALDDMVDASTETIFAMSETEFTTNLPLALSVKKSHSEPDVTIACADITKELFL